MLLNLELNHFRRHKALTLDFKPGLNVIRGRNEGGKSTILEAMLYALYGTRALRDPLSETVTWGHKESELSVRLKIQVGPYIYTFKRSKSGAEVIKSDESNVGGEVTTGQNEVSNVATEILGADLKSVASLMMASQNALRGALDEGPAAVSSLMSKLADFDMIDRMLDKANSTLTTGAVQPLQAQLAQEEERLEGVKLNPPRDPVPVRAKLDEVQLKWQNATAVVQRTTGELLKAEDLFNHVKKLQDRHDAVLTEIGGIVLKRVGLGQQIESLKKVLPVDEADLEAARERVAKAQNHAQDLSSYQSFLRANAAYPEVFWDEPEDTFDKAFADAEAAVNAARANVAKIDGQILAKQDQLIKDGKCPTCGHDRNDPEHMARHNAGINAELAQLRSTRGALVAAHEGALSDRQGLQMVAKAATAYLSSMAPWARKVTWDTSVHPRKAVWAADVPAAAPDASAKADLQALIDADRAYQQAQGQLGALAGQISEGERKEAELKAEIEELTTAIGGVELADLKRACENHASKVAAARLEQENLGKEYDAIKAELSVIDMESRHHAQMLESATRSVEQLKASIKTIEFNNALMKKLKAMKPMITDFLWGQVLKAVGLFFSQMRGEQSVVTKDAGGFKVNGRSVESLSGSTLDVLALAIRCALVKTFIPHANFLILDEPAAGCDEARTGSVLGFVATAGFSQTIMASHDPLSESVADNVINIGG